MEAYAVHHLVHDEGGPGHVARVLHEGDEEVEDHDVGKEDDHASHAADNAVHDQVFEWSLCHVSSYQVAQLLHQPFDGCHGIAPQPEGGLEHQPKKYEEEGEAQVLVRHQGVYQFGTVGELGLLAQGLFQSPGDEAVTGVGKSRLRIFPQQLLHICPLLVAPCQDLLLLTQLSHLSLHILVPLQQLDAEVAKRYFPTRCFCNRQLPLHDGDRFLRHPSIGYLHIPVLFLPVHRNHLLQQLWDPFTSFTDRRHHRCVDQFGEGLMVEGATALFQLVVHVEGDHYRHLQVDQLGGEVEVALQR